MLTDIHDRLMRAKERLRRAQKLDAMLRSAQTALDEKQRRCWGYEQVLDKEQGDVEKLEGFGLAGLFYSVLGTKQERLEQERQEYLAAKLKHEECTQAVDDARQEVEALRAELAAFQDADAEYNPLLEEKQRLLTRVGDQRTARLMSISERLADLEADRQELQEAVRAGKRAQSALEHVRSELGSAENWGTWDMLGGGTLATWAKHSRIDSAKRQAQVAQRELHRFQKELADADQRLQVTLGDIGGFSTFADYFFDGLIADWVVQSKIQKASDACASAVSRVAAALSQCRRRLSETEQQMERVASQRRAFIEKA